MPGFSGQSLGRYNILEQLGEGGMATVFKAYDTRLERDVAIKIIRRGAFPPEQLERILKRFEREAKALARLTHPNIVHINDYGERDGAPYLVMDYLPGGTLKQRLGKPIPWQEVVKLLLPVAEALDYAHSQNIIHRDVKPSNILLTQRGQPLLTDFGIAKILDIEETHTLTSTGIGIGTPEYMAPEQSSSKNVDQRADVYALGIVFFEMLTGRRPFEADTPMAVMIMHARDPLPSPRQVVPDLPRKVEHVLNKALAKKPEDRYPDMANFAQVMENLLAGQSRPSRPVVKPAASESRMEAIQETIDHAATRDAVVDPTAQAVRIVNPPDKPPAVPAASPPPNIGATRKRRIPSWAIILIVFIILAGITVIVSPFLRQTTPSQPDPTNPGQAEILGILPDATQPPAAVILPTATPLPTEAPIFLNVRPPLDVIPSGPNFLIQDNTGGNNAQGKPAIAFDQVNFLLGWDQDPGSFSLNTNIYAARISPASSVLDPARIAVSTQGNQAVGPPSVIFDGVQYLMVWVARRSDVFELYAARILPDGTVLDPGGVILTSGGDPLLQYQKIGLVIDGTNTLVVWRTRSNKLRGARISTSPGIHTLDDPAGFPIARLGGEPSVAFDGNIFLVTWDGRQDIYGARVTRDGTVLDPDGFAICSATGVQGFPTVGFNGTSFWVVWFNQGPNNDSIHGSAYGARVSSDGTVLDKPAIKIAERARGNMSPQINCQGAQCLVVWNVEYNGIGENCRLTDVYARRLTQDGRVFDPQAIPISTSEGHQFEPVIGYGAGHYLIAWSDSTGMRTWDGAIWGQILVEQNLSNAMAVVPSHSPPVSQTRPQQRPGWTQETAPVLGYASDGLSFNALNSRAFGDKQRLSLQNGTWKSDTTNGIYNWAAWGDRPDNLWVGGWAGAIQHFNGITWTDMGMFLLNPQHIITGMWGTSSGSIWATADSGLIIKHNNAQALEGGWQQIATGSPYDLEDIWGSKADDIYAVGERGTILHYSGKTWDPVASIPTNQTLNAIWGSGPDDIFVVGDWGVILHYDGVHWSLQTNTSNQHLFDVWGFNGQDVYAAGFSGTILHYDGLTWTPEITGSTQDLLSVWGTQDLSAGKKIVWASGNGKTILKQDFDEALSSIK